MSTWWRHAAVVVVAVTVAALQAPALAGASADAFAGAWQATDPVDGSSLKLQISGPNKAGVRHVTYTDGFASGCGAPASAIGSGTDDGTTLSATLDIRCGGTLFATDVPFTWTVAGDTLVGGDGIVFVRAGGP